MMNSIPSYKTWLPAITSLWQPKSESLSAKQDLQKTLAKLDTTLARLDKSVELNTHAIAKLTQYLASKGL